MCLKRCLCLSGLASRRVNFIMSGNANGDQNVCDLSENDINQLEETRISKKILEY